MYWRTHKKACQGWAVPSSGQFVTLIPQLLYTCISFFRIMELQVLLAGFLQFWKSPPPSSHANQHRKSYLTWLQSWQFLPFIQPCSLHLRGCTKSYRGLVIHFWRQNYQKLSFLIARWSLLEILVLSPWSKFGGHQGCTLHAQNCFFLFLFSKYSFFVALSISS